MKFTLINKLFNLLKSESVNSDEVDCKSELIVSTLEDQQEIISYTKRVFGTGKIDKNQFTLNELFDDVIKNFTEYCYTLPASEGYHHSREKGLLIHSLQVSNRALRQAKNQFLPAKEMLDVERLRISRYYYASWLCGLLHDAGKMYTDMLVTDSDNPENIWLPLAESLLDWKLRTNVINYKVEWKKDRLHKKHDNVSINILHYVLTPAARKYISQCPDDLLAEITDTLSGYQHRDGYIHNAVRIADTISTAEDIKIIWDEKLGPRNAALHEKIIKAMQELSGSWILKKELIILQDEVYLRWPQCIDQVIKKLLIHDSTIPHKSSTLLTTMTERGIVKGLLDEQYAMYYPDIITEEDSLALLNGKSVKGGKGFIRLEWPFHALADKPLPKNNIGLLKITQNNDAILFTEKSSRLFSQADLDTLNTDSSDSSPSTREDENNLKTTGTQASTSNKRAPKEEITESEGNTTIPTQSQNTATKNDAQTAPSEDKTSPKNKRKKKKPKPLADNPLVVAKNSKTESGNATSENGMAKTESGNATSKNSTTPNEVINSEESDSITSESKQTQMTMEYEVDCIYGHWVHPNKELGRSEELIQLLLDNDCFESIAGQYLLRVDDNFYDLTKSNPNTINVLISARYLTPKSRVEHLMFLVINSVKYLPLCDSLDNFLNIEKTKSTQSDTPEANKSKIEPETNKTKKVEKDKKNAADRSECSSTIKVKERILKSLLDRGIDSELSEKEDDIGEAISLLKEGNDYKFEGEFVHINFHSLCTKGVHPKTRELLVKGAKSDFEIENSTYIEY